MKNATLSKSRSRITEIPSETPTGSVSDTTTAGVHAAAVVAGETSKPIFKKNGLTLQPLFSKPGVHPFDEIEWDKRTAEITDDSGKVIFKQEDVEVPKSWSVLATKIAVSKYFYGDIAHGADPAQGGRETSVKQLVHRVTRTIANWGIQDGYFKTAQDAETFYNELTWLCVNQHGAFNSPVWFNVGLYHQYGVGKESGRGNYFFNRATGQTERAQTQYEYPQGSACFIQSVDDNMESIMDLARSEAMLFKFGSGTGSDLSTIRSTREKMSGGGRPSGPLSFLKVYDQIANVVKSGGKTRRAAKMNTLKDWHPDVEEFIEAKQKEERKAWALIEQGYDGSYNGDAYGSIMYQNENLSVRVSDEFMDAAIQDREFWTRTVREGKPCEKKRAKELLRKISEGTWICGDPGLQFDDTIHGWHTCKGTDRQHSTNPCSEYLFLNNTACNLASLNLMKFKKTDGSFDTDRFKAAVRVFIIAQEIVVDNASYPTDKIAENSHIFRTLGLGYANLGSLIMSYGKGYDSDEGRGLAGAITALMTGHAYEVSAEIAAATGPFPGYHDSRCAGVEKTVAPDNVESMLEVIERHLKACADIDSTAPAHLRRAASEAWEAALAKGREHGYRNAQVTVLAPTGTIGFLMDCDTTGIEPDIALVKYKLLAGGGMLKIVNQTVPTALKELGYNAGQISEIIDYIDKNDTIEGAPHLQAGHTGVFDCAFRPAQGERSLHYRAHIKMMAAAQPFLSGAISKTVNLPNSATVEDIMQTYIEAWKLGLKAVAIYRDGSKRSAPLNVKKTKDMGTTEKAEAAPAPAPAPARPVRRRMSDTRISITHKFDIAGHEGYLTVGLFDDDKQPGELFITMAKEGSTIGGLMDTIGTLVSLALQYGVPIEAMVKKFAHTRFEPSGFTKNPDIRNAKSIPDYIFRWMGNQFIPGYREANNPNAGQQELPIKEIQEIEKKTLNKPVPDLQVSEDSPNITPHRLNRATIETDSSELVIRFRDGLTCPECGSSKIKHTGSCATCLNCGASLGCS
ncbi:MAG TPA: vitamin B12-dependent ribonucleotide reductase [Candidatus Methylacidiphilales bacterium]|nr:vitamin B12-dependent ribonucleotide reductase [Candidatus Methylacidiphilales bacterium]